MKKSTVKKIWAIVEGLGIGALYSFFIVLGATLRLFALILEVIVLVYVYARSRGDYRVDPYGVITLSVGIAIAIIAELCSYVLWRYYFG